jgi:sugar diacid utilization regulator
VTVPTVSDVAGSESEVALRDQLSSLQGLLALSMLMTEGGNERHILNLATTSVPSFGPCRVEGLYLVDGGWRTTAGQCADATVRADVEAQLTVLSAAGGAIGIPHAAWGWAFPLRSLEGHLGHLVVAGDREPSASEQFLLRVLAQQTGIAMANARSHARERETAGELRAANIALADTVSALERSTAIHDRLTRVAMEGEGQEGIARAVHELTGLPVAIEDRHGNLWAWAGPDRPNPYPKDPPALRQQLLQRAIYAGQPIRERGRIYAVASPDEDMLGVLVLVDPAGHAGDQEQVALEHGRTVLAMDLARLKSLADTELRLGGDLVEELLVGGDEERALARARALGYDLERPHRVIVVEGTARALDDEAFFHAVRRAAGDTRVGSLLAMRGGSVVVLADTDLPWERFRSSVLAQLGRGRCQVGVGGVCDRPADFPRSFREAALALRMQAASQSADRATAFDRLGVYRILADVEDTSGIERFARDWLGSLLEYDERKRSDLVTTLTRYLECGGNYDATAEALATHRNTLKYRLKRIREISGHDLGDAETNFNLQLATRAWQTLRALRDDI